MSAKQKHMTLKSEAWEFSILLGLSLACLAVGIFGAGFVLGAKDAQPFELFAASLAAMGICMSVGLPGLSAYFTNEHVRGVRGRQTINARSATSLGAVTYSPICFRYGDSETRKLDFTEMRKHE
jgi:hypothetical protein